MYENNEIDNNNRILVIDDNEAIHDDFKAILNSRGNTTDAIISEKEDVLFGSVEKDTTKESFEVYSAYQGKEGLEKVQQALQNGQPYAMAFVDIRMPPGWDGIETVKKIWEVDSDIQIVLCSAYSDYRYSDIMEKIGRRDNLLFLRKPFDNIELAQLAHALTRKWSLAKRVALDVNNLEQSVRDKAKKLEKTNSSLQQKIVEHKQTQEILKHERDKIQKYLDVAGVILLVIDRNQCLTLINNKGCQIFGCNEKDMIGKDWCTNFIPEHIRTEVRSVISAMLEGNLEQFEYYENPILTRNGQQRFIAWHNTVLYDDKGRIEALLSSGNDITESKKAQEDARLAYQQLQGANNELKEMQSQIIQNEKLASIGQLAAGVAHEMNTPVGFVASNFQTIEKYVKSFLKLLSIYDEIAGQIETFDKIQLLEKKTLIDKARDEMHIDFILDDIQQLFDDSREGLERVTGIIQNLRDFSRVDQSQDVCEYNINDGIKTTLIVAKSEIKYDVDIVTNFSDLPDTFCNSGQINQVFLNIFVNAAQAIKSQERDGNGTITVTTYCDDKDVICEIADDGPGIETEALSRIFDPFFTTKPAGKGTGLGLSVSHDIIVNKHKGQLLVDSTIGEGTKFTIKLPVNCKTADSQKDVKDGRENSVVC